MLENRANYRGSQVMDVDSTRGVGVGLEQESSSLIASIVWFSEVRIERAVR